MKIELQTWGLDLPRWTGILLFFGFLVLSAGARAESSVQDQINRIENQISGIMGHVHDLQVQLEALKKQAEETDAVQDVTVETVVPTSSNASVSQLAVSESTGDGETLKPGQMRFGSTVLSLDGFFDASLVYRSRNLTADIGTPFASVPFSAQGDLGRNSEIRGSARASRLSLKIENEDTLKHTGLRGYVETDFLGAGSGGANQQQVNGYQTRLRQVWLAADDTRADGFHFLAGQAYSLVTPGRGRGLGPLQENLPPVVDDQMVVGTDFVRQWQLRLVKDFGLASVGFSVENPQTIWGNAIMPNGFVRFVTAEPPHSSLGTTSVSIDAMPDMVLKLALDPSFGHFEAFGLRRVFQLDAGPNGGTVSTSGLAGGLNALVPVGDVLNFTGQVSYGDGLGRYGAAQLPDATNDSYGKPVAIPALHALAGVTYQPSPKWSVYLYGGLEKAFSAGDSTVGGQKFGYGNSDRLNNGCNGTVNALMAGTTFCDGDTEMVSEITAGGWFNLFQGEMGTLQFGPQLAYLRRTLFADVNNIAPSTEDWMLFASFRYTPFKVE